jgi:hypothetical protein
VSGQLCVLAAQNDRNRRPARYRLPSVCRYSTRVAGFLSTCARRHQARPINARTCLFLFRPLLCFHHRLQSGVAASYKIARAKTVKSHKLGDVVVGARVEQVKVDFRSLSSSSSSNGQSCCVLSTDVLARPIRHRRRLRYVIESACCY